MAAFEKTKSGIPMMDDALQNIRLGDNVVWQVPSLDEFRYVAERFANQAISDGRNLIYIRFAEHKPILTPREGLRIEHPNYGTVGGNDTNDRIFLLSLQELQQYFNLSATWTDYEGRNHNVAGNQYYIGGSKDLITSPTAYAEAREVWINNSDYHDAEGKKSCQYWWLRSPGARDGLAAGVYYDGSVEASGFDVRYFKHTVRPALWVNLAS